MRAARAKDVSLSEGLVVLDMISVKLTNYTAKEQVREVKHLNLLSIYKYPVPENYRICVPGSYRQISACLPTARRQLQQE